MEIEDSICSLEMDFGMTFSNQIRSSRRDAVFWLRCRLNRGIRRCIVIG